MFITLIESPIKIMTIFIAIFNLFWQVKRLLLEKHQLLLKNQKSLQKMVATELLWSARSEPVQSLILNGFVMAQRLEKARESSRQSNKKKMCIILN